MIIVSGTIDIDPASHDAAVALANTLVEATLLEEGNITYGFWADLNTPGRFRVYEEWQDEEALNLHFATPHMGTFMESLGGLGVTGTSINRHDVSASAALM